MLFTNLLTAQKTIAVLTGSNWTFYTDFSTALNQCAAGSTIYLPGGTFGLSQNSDTIFKDLTIIGVGHYPDSTSATGKTLVQSKFYIGNGVQSLNISGVHFSNIFGLNGNVSGVVNSIFLNRVRLDNGLILSVTNGYNKNLIANECVLQQTLGMSNPLCEAVFNNCILLLYNNTAQSVDNITFKNCVFRFSSAYCCFNCSNCLFENSIICSGIGPNLTSNPSIYSTFKNNLFMTSFPVTPYNTLINNLSGGSLANTFVNVPSTTSFSYNYDYHLLSTSVGVNSGTDGTDIGIYGTIYPYKPSAVPANPHISTKSISPSSVPNGTLPVNIRVIAQDR